MPSLDDPLQWYGFDFDGTLAVDEDATDFVEDPRELEPIWMTVEKVKEYLTDGQIVKVVSGRAAVKGYGDEPPALDRKQVAWIQEWLVKHVGEALPVQYWKDRHMVELWDDKAVQVFKNVGIRVDSFVWR